jgi:hypothetical protein
MINEKKKEKKIKEKKRKFQKIKINKNNKKYYNNTNVCFQIKFLYLFWNKFSKK